MSVLLKGCACPCIHGHVYNCVSRAATEEVLQGHKVGSPAHLVLQGAPDCHMLQYGGKEEKWNRVSKQKIIFPVPYRVSICKDRAERTEGLGFAVPLATHIKDV